MRTLAIIIVTFVAAASALATAVMVPLVYLMGWDTVQEPFYYTTVSLVALGLPAAIVYIVSNVASGIADQEHPALYWLDNVASVVAWMSITVTAILVLFGLFQVNSDIARVFQAFLALPLLVVLLIFSWIDVLFLQRRKLVMIGSTLTNPNAPMQLSQVQPVSAPRTSAFGSIAMGLLVIGLIAAAAYMWGAPARQAKATANAANAPQQTTPAATPPARSASRQATPAARPATQTAVSPRLTSDPKVIAQRVEHPFADVSKERQYRCRPDGTGKFVRIPEGQPGGWCYDD